MKVTICFKEANTNERDLVFNRITKVKIDSTSISVHKDGIANAVYDGSTILNEIEILEDETDKEEEEA